MRPSATPVAEPPPTFEPFAHFVSSAWTCAREHDFRYLPPNLRLLSKCTTVAFVAKSGSPGFGCVISSMLRRTFLGFFAVPFVLGLTDALMAVVGVTAWATPATLSAVIAATAMRVNLRMDVLSGWLCCELPANTHPPPGGGFLRGR